MEIDSYINPVKSHTQKQKEIKIFNQLGDAEVREIMGRQQWLDDNADMQYDAFVKKQNIVQWFEENLWNKLSFIVEDK